MKKKTVAFDTDGTLITFSEEPKTEIIKLLKMFKDEFDCEIIVWSAAGDDYAEQWVKTLGLTKWVDKTMDKLDVFMKTVDNPNPDITFDDEEKYNLGKINIKVGKGLKGGL